MKTIDYVDLYERTIPASLRSDWDNDGTMIYAGEREVKKILFTLDCTFAAAEYAVEGGFDLIVTHHPLIFHPLKSVTDPRITLLLRAGISVLSYHTRLDAVQGGVNDTLASLFGLTDVTPFGEEEMGRLGTLPGETDLPELVGKVKDLLGCPSVTVAGKREKIRTLALLGGSGKDYIDAAWSAGADAFLTGEVSYNALSDAADRNMPVLCAGHYYTEQPVCAVLERLAKTLDPSVGTEVFACLRIEEC